MLCVRRILGCRATVHLFSLSQGVMWHMEPQSENNGEKKKRRKKKVEMKEGDEQEEVIERNEENENISKSWKQR